MYCSCGLCVLGIPQLILYSRFLSTLRNKYPETWGELGSPSLIRNNTVGNNMKVLSFLKKQKYLKLNDPQFSSMAKFLRVYSMIYIGYFVVVALLLIAIIFTGDKSY